MQFMHECQRMSKREKEREFWHCKREKHIVWWWWAMYTSCMWKDRKRKILVKGVSSFTRDVDLSSFGLLTFYKKGQRWMWLCSMVLKEQTRLLNKSKRPNFETKLSNHIVSYLKEPHFETKFSWWNEKKVELLVTIRTKRK